MLNFVSFELFWHLCKDLSLLKKVVCYIMFSCISFFVQAFRTSLYVYSNSHYKKINLRLVKFTLYLRTYEYDMQVFDNITCSPKLGAAKLTSFLGYKYSKNLHGEKGKCGRDKH